ncbi:MAG: hypothetical protein JO167_07380 [Alphaproteobacteria bacterium]|nr:hypothetical protein [Alphaproteobacteria bacterium]MBV9903051.1 hypothetical protein [Alphaproteobacteria bacterium]
MKPVAIITATALLLSSAALAAPNIARHAEGGTNGKPINLPRLKGVPDAKVMAKVNAALADMEKEARDGLKSCVDQLKEQKMKPTGDSFFYSFDVTYLSDHYMSVTGTSEYDCGGAHPDTDFKFVTYDLTTGAALNWDKEFKAGFTDGGDTNMSPFNKLYIARYRLPVKKDGDECRDWVKDGTFMPDFKLDQKLGVVAVLNLPHVVAACGDDMPLTQADLKTWLKDQKLAADLKANVKPK